MFSPHRFVNDHEFITEVTPIHGSLLQFLHQYICLSCDTLANNESIPSDCNQSEDCPNHHKCVESVGQWRSRMILTTSDFSICGRRMATFDRMRQEDRESIAAVMQYQSIGERLRAAMASSDRQQTLAEWLFAFCIEALNDMRVDEVWHQDYLTRLGASLQFSGLVIKEINDSVNHSVSRKNSKDLINTKI